MLPLSFELCRNAYAGCKWVLAGHTSCWTSHPLNLACPTWLRSKDLLVSSFTQKQIAVLARMASFISKRYTCHIDNGCGAYSHLLICLSSLPECTLAIKHHHRIINFPHYSSFSNPRYLSSSWPPHPRTLCSGVRSFLAIARNRICQNYCGWLCKLLGWFLNALDLGW